MQRIGENRIQEIQWSVKAKRKEALFRKLVSEAQKHVNDIDLASFAQSPLNTLKSALYEKHGAPSYLNTNKLVKELDINLTEFERMTSEYLSINVQFDAQTCKAIKPDFGIYATTDEQVKSYKIAKKVADAVNEAIEQGHTIYGGDLSRATNGMLMIDFANLPKVEVNPHYILRFK